MKTIINYLGVIICVIAIASCSVKEELAVVSSQEVYNDGFEVLLIDNDTMDSFHLKDAEETVKKTSSATFLLPQDTIGTLEKKLEIQVKDTPESRYPFVSIDLEVIENKKQIIDVSFHYSKSTYHYCYEALPKEIKPLWSSYSDLARNKKTIYK